MIKGNILKRIDRLIRLKATGTPADLAKKINVSERCIYNYLNYMKELGCPILYSHSIKSYYYEFEGKLQIGFVEKSIEKNQLSKIKGGCLNYFQQYNFFTKHHDYY